ncbi:MAG: FAD-binding oxidoreductase [Proteobacteria bacterium]|nr:FAD-binding oxidoreductase [Pseudomonadota bacterium]
MQQMPWSSKSIKQFKEETKLAVLFDEHLPSSFSRDFGKILLSKPLALCQPNSTDECQRVIQFAEDKNLSITIRGKGLSQGGQSLAKDGGFILHTEKLNRFVANEDESIWCEANCTFAELLEYSLKNNQIPYVLPYNCNLSLGGVISAGGLGASSFKLGTVSAHVKALEVVLSDGQIQIIDEKSPLFHACLSGQGRFALITKVCLKLRKARPFVKTFFLIYLNKKEWLNDLQQMKSEADFIEAFCTPAIQGLRLANDNRKPFAEWFYVIHVSKEFEKKAPHLEDISTKLTPWKVLHHQEESIYSYLHRHDSRFVMMKNLGQWDLFHPWYECFIKARELEMVLDEWLDRLPLHFANIVQVVPIAKIQQRGFFMLPEENDFYEIMVLNPGISEPLLPSCIETIKGLDKDLLAKGGKRYLSGFLGQTIEEGYWRKHFADKYQDWCILKKQFDKKSIFSSFLHPD